jgi:hypothetical protein
VADAAFVDPDVVRCAAWSDAAYAVPYAAADAAYVDPDVVRCAAWSDAAYAVPYAAADAAYVGHGVVRCVAHAYESGESYVAQILSTVCYAYIVIADDDRSSREYVMEDDSPQSNHGYGGGSNTHDDVYHSIHLEQDNNHTRNRHWIVNWDSDNCQKIEVQHK